MLEPARIEWRDERPYSTAFDDIYFSTDGRAEVERVFVAPSGLRAAMEQQDLVTVGELGFGTGLNFAVVREAFAQHPSKRLHFISFEKHPLLEQDWRLESMAPLPCHAGWHRRVFDAGRVTLSVYHGDVADGLDDLNARQHVPVDVWFLDGFAPARNPEMWSADVFNRIAASSREGTTVSTFTAAGAVRRGLEAAGFNVRKVDQRPMKRESVAGRLNTATSPVRARTPHITVFGAGIAGCSVARHLADQGLIVTLADPNGVAAGASRMSATVLHGRLLGDGSHDAEFRRAAFHYAGSYVERFGGFQRTGALQTKGPNLDAGRIERILRSNPYADAWLRVLNDTSATELAGVPVNDDALWFPTAGIVDLPTLCRDLIDHPSIELVQSADREPPYVIAAASAARDFPGCANLEIADVFGQLDWVRGDALPRIPIVGNGYAVPGLDECAIGATYEYSEWPIDEATRHNATRNRHIVGSASSVRQQRAARCVSSDRRPVVGRLEEGVWITTAHGSLGTTSAPTAAAIIASDILGWIPPVSKEVVDLLDPHRFAARQARRGIRHIRPQSPSH